MDSQRLGQITIFILAILTILGGISQVAEAKGKPPRPETWHVPDDWPTIQAAIDGSSNGDTVIVRPGTYIENIHFLGKAITVSSEQGPEVTTIDGGMPVDPDFASVVLFQSGEGPDSILEGFTLTNGTGTYHASYNGHRGGGAFCDTSSPTIRNNIISGNTAIRGGGVSCIYSSATIGNNLISENTATGHGGGIRGLYSDLLIMNNTILNNVSSARGGGLSVGSHTFVQIINNVIAWNTAKKGGGIHCGWGMDEMTNNTVFENTATEFGGGLYVDNYESSTITNTIWWYNDALSGQEIYLGTANGPTAVTISYSDVYGGQFSCHVEPDCVLDWGAGMIDAVPLFVDPVIGDFHLTQGSPCKNAGDNNAPSLPTQDFEGDARIVDGVVDMGADESDAGGEQDVLAFDGFESRDFEGGTGNWIGPWMTAGDISIRWKKDEPQSGNGHVRLRRDTGIMERVINLAGASEVRLTFWAKVSSFEGSDAAYVYVSSDGVNYSEIKGFTSSDSDDSYHAYDIDLSGFTVTSDFRIVFDAQMDGRDDYWFIDDIEITGVF